MRNGNKPTQILRRNPGRKRRMTLSDLGFLCLVGLVMWAGAAILIAWAFGLGQFK